MSYASANHLLDQNHYDDDHDVNGTDTDDAAIKLRKTRACKLMYGNIPVVLILLNGEDG